MGISHKEFLGWDEREQDKMLALKLYEDTRLCPLCGGPLSECTDPANEMAYKVDPPTRCHKQTAIMRYQENDGQWDKRPYNRALMIVARFIQPKKK